jgi:hypothetical protein
VSDRDGDANGDRPGSMASAGGTSELASAAPSSPSRSATASAPSTKTRGFALAAARALGAAAESFCRAHAPSAHGDGAALGRLAAELAGAEAQARAALALGRLQPAGLERIDRSWYVPPARSTRPAAAAHLARAAYAHLAPMDDDDSATPYSIESDDSGPNRVPDVARAPGGAATPSLSHHSVAELEGALVTLGRRRVALAFVGAPRAGLAQLCARLGEPAASALVADVRALKTAAHDEVKAAQRALFTGAGSGEDGELGGGGDRAQAFFFRVGAAWLAPALARDADELRRLAQRLPRALGQTLLDAAAAPSSEAERTAVLARLANVVERDL